MLGAIKSLVRSLPGMEAISRKKTNDAIAAKYAGMTPHQVFNAIYEWKCQHLGPDSALWDGATIEQTRAITRALPGLLQEVGAGSLLDAGCGDFTWLSAADLHGIQYVGVDFLEPTQAKNARYANQEVSFITADFLNADLPRADVILCRDVLVHLSDEQTRQAIANFKRSGAQWLLTTTFPNQTRNWDTPTGGWRALNFQQAPWNWAAPARLITEGLDDPEFADKALGLWRLSAL